MPERPVGAGYGRRLSGSHDPRAPPPTAPSGCFPQTYGHFEARLPDPQPRLGGYWPGDPDSTPFPNTLVVDYVRVPDTPEH
ncbi:hypothetical protein [Actinophytocola sp. NPDC049390]|uniref:hypothetical protein n=1 Tax=Actinophytocola sp. NPDC049390 TaxID=3363894 RepID=UPI00378D2D47